jgi:ribonuclease P protein component
MAHIDRQQPPWPCPTAAVDRKGQGKTERQRFTKSQRLLKRRNYEQLRFEGRKVHSAWFLSISTVNGTERSRLGVTASRKVGNAVVRNRVKRVTREYFRQNRQYLKKCRDIHVIAKQGVAEQANQILFLSLETLFRKMDALDD